MEVEGTATSVRMLGGLILLDLTRGSQRRKVLRLLPVYTRVELQGYE